MGRSCAGVCHITRNQSGELVQFGLVQQGNSQFGKFCLGCIVQGESGNDGNPEVHHAAKDFFSIADGIAIGQAIQRGKGREEFFFLKIVHPHRIGGV